MVGSADPFRLPENLGVPKLPTARSYGSVSGDSADRVGSCSMGGRPQ